MPCGMQIVVDYTSQEVMQLIVWILFYQEISAMTQQGPVLKSVGRSASYNFAL